MSTSIPNLKTQRQRVTKKQNVIIKMASPLLADVSQKKISTTVYVKSGKKNSPMASGERWRRPMGGARCKTSTFYVAQIEKNLRVFPRSLQPMSVVRPFVFCIIIQSHVFVEIFIVSFSKAISYDFVLISSWNCSRKNDVFKCHVFLIILVYTCVLWRHKYVY